MLKIFVYLSLIILNTQILYSATPTIPQCKMIIQAATKTAPKTATHGKKNFDKHVRERHLGNFNNIAGLWEETKIKKSFFFTDDRIKLENVIQYVINKASSHLYDGDAIDSQINTNTAYVTHIAATATDPESLIIHYTFNATTLSAAPHVNGITYHFQGTTHILGFDERANAETNTIEIILNRDLSNTLPHNGWRFVTAYPVA